MRSGLAQLPLHGGKAPHWLFSRMTRLAREITCHIVDEFGPREMLGRLSDPYWFQAFGCVLGFDWHSSGVTTTTCGAVKEGIKELESDLGFYACGGKGATSRKTPSEINTKCDKLAKERDDLVYASKMSAKVDNSALQDGFTLYHHCFFFTDDGWTVVQQGFDESKRTARRYHWISSELDSFTVEPHSAICCDKTKPTLNLVANESKDNTSIMTELANLPPDKLQKDLQKLPNLVMPDRHPVTIEDVNSRYLKKIFEKTYESAPKDFESLLGIEGVGPKTLRALSLTAEIIYEAKVSTKDPARFSFDHGGKDGTPYPVDINTYEKTIEVLSNALDKSRVDRSEKIKALKRLGRFSGGYATA